MDENIFKYYNIHILYYIMTKTKPNFLETTFADRKAESSRMLVKYPERICAYVTRASGETDLPEINRNKYLI